MKKALLTPILLAICTLSFCQHFPQRNLKDLKPALERAAPSPAPPADLAPHHPLSPIGVRGPEENIGQTRFDLQTVNSLGRRVADFGDGKLGATWLFGIDNGAGWPDRGAAHNGFDGSAWGPLPTARVEATRSGYPSSTNTAGGTEVILSHKNTSATQWYLTAHTKLPTENAWTEHVIPSTVTGGPVWSKVAAGGPDGNTLHVLAVAVAPDFGGVVYEGVNQQPLYFRSPDGGQTWDKVDVIIPGLDSSFYSSVSGEAYQIEANGTTVAVAVFDSWGDVAVFKSEDNGNTWDKTIVHDFPLDKWDGTDYTQEDIPFDSYAPSEIAILTSDAAGSIVVDNNGKVHVFFGWMYVEGSGGGRFYYPGMSGLAYWKEGFATNAATTIADLEDFDGDTLVTLAGIAPYFTSLTSHPSAGVDSEGNLYVVYSAVHESYVEPGQSQNYRHIFILKSSDGGDTWSAPFDLINGETTDPDFVSFIEASFPSIPAHVGGAIHVVYQQDFNPGMFGSGNSHPVMDNYIMYFNVDKNSIGTVNAVGETNQDKVTFALAPNPAATCAKASFELKKAASVQLSVFNLLGDRISFFKKDLLPPGHYQELIDVSNLASGIYMVRLETDGGPLVKKLVVQQQ